MISYSWSMPKIETNTVAKRKECPWSKVPSLDTRRTGAIPKPKSIKSTEHTIAPA